MKVKYVVQFKSVYTGENQEWRDCTWQHEETLENAMVNAKLFRSVNPNVRLIKRTVIEEELEIENYPLTKTSEV